MPMLATKQSVEQAVRMHSTTKDSPDLPTTLAAYLTTLKQLSEVNESPEADV